MFKRFFSFFLIPIFFSSCSFFGSEASRLPIQPESQISAELPIISLESVKDFDAIARAFSLTEEKKRNLQGNYFILADSGSFDDFGKAYGYLRDKGLPVLITMDTLLHLFHLQFSETLRMIEEKYFFNDLWDLSRLLYEEFRVQEKVSQDEKLKAAYRFLQAYLAVGMNLMRPDADQVSNTESAQGNSSVNNGLFEKAEAEQMVFQMDPEIEALAKQELSLIFEHNQIIKSPLFGYQEDYTKYVPRGHYLSSEHLKNYFQAMTWFGRMGFLFQGGCAECLINAEEADSQTVSALLFAKTLAQKAKALDYWKGIFDITSFYVGKADDLVPADYQLIYDELFGGNELKSFEDIKAKLAEIYKKLKERDAAGIYGGLGSCGQTADSSADSCVKVTAGMRFFPQRFTLDSYLMGQMVYPNVKEYRGTQSRPFSATMVDSELIKAFPSGLELFALLGSKDARSILENKGETNYQGYGEKFNSLRSYVANISETEWSGSLYFQWFRDLKDVTLGNANLPEFMNTSVWKRKDLVSSLASWAELKHDTVLYAKQAYTPIKVTSAGQAERLDNSEPPPGYVEPRLVLYQSMEDNLANFGSRLKESQLFNEAIEKKFNLLQEVLDSLISISQKQLDKSPLSNEEQTFINDFVKKYTELSGFDSSGSVMVADIFTDLNSGQVLQEATGYLRFLILVYEDIDGTLRPAVGPVMSYYEFKQPLDKVLDDEKWKEVLENGGEVVLPDWAP